MTKAFLILSITALIFTACGKTSEPVKTDPSKDIDTSIPANMHTPKTVGTNTSPGNWNTNCIGTYKNKMGTLIISEYSDSSLTFTFKLTTAGEDMCTGEMEGVANINDGLAVFEKWYEMELCGIRFKFDGKKTIEIDEDTNCLAYHGEECPFAGTYKKK